MQRIAFPTSNHCPSRNQELKLKTKHVLELLNLKKNPAPFNIPFQYSHIISNTKLKGNLIYSMHYVSEKSVGLRKNVQPFHLYRCKIHRVVLLIPTYLTKLHEKKTYRKLKRMRPPIIVSKWVQVVN